MGSEKRGADSSSPNVDPIILSIETRGATGDTAKISLDTGSSFFIPTNLVITESLCGGMTLGPELLERLARESAVHEAVRKAVSLLAARDHSAFELRRKLAKRELPGYAVDRAIDSLIEAGYVDDRRFALAFIETRLRKSHEGYAALLSGLLRRGVDRSCAQSALEEGYTAQAERTAMEALREQLSRRGAVSPERLSSLLMAKGFPYGRIREFLRELADGGGSRSDDRDADGQIKNY